MLSYINLYKTKGESKSHNFCKNSDSKFMDKLIKFALTSVKECIIIYYIQVCNYNVFKQLFSGS